MERREGGGIPPDMMEPLAPTETSATPESRETVEANYRLTVETAVLGCIGHLERCEDGIAGDLSRIDDEAKRDVPLFTPKELVDVDRAITRKAGEREKTAAPLLKERQVYVVTDGISGYRVDGRYSGNGYIASRLSTAAAVERMTAMPIEADEEATMQAMKDAFNQGNRETKAHVIGRLPPFDVAGTAMTMMRVLTRPDGGPQVVYASAGNVRIYRVQRSSMTAMRLTFDDTPLETALRRQLTEKEAQRLKLEPETKRWLELPELRRVQEAVVETDVPSNLQEWVRRRELNSMLFPPRSVVGVASESTGVMSHVDVLDAEVGDEFFVLTDGFHSLATEERLQEILLGEDPVKQLRLLARGDGNHDDAAVVRIRIEAKS
ncbi:MAG: hypothetical protein PHT12_06530 [Patescibacteria group bacterium]|nr:hypothetical protein [Patescibacteria group bacterium]